MRKNNLTASYFQVSLVMAGFYLSFAPLFGLLPDVWLLLLAVLVIVNLAIWPVVECLPKLSMLTSLSSDLTPLLGRVLPRTLVGVVLGSLVVTLQFEKANPFTDIIFVAFLIFTLLYVYCAYLIYQVQFDETTFVYKGLLSHGQIQLHEVKEMNKCVGLLYRVKYESETHRGQIYFLDHFIDGSTVEGDQTSLRKFLSCYLNTTSKLDENEVVRND